MSLGTVRLVAVHAGLDSARPYDLRHSFALLLFAQGTNPAEVASSELRSMYTRTRFDPHVLDRTRRQR